MAVKQKTKWLCMISILVVAVSSLAATDYAPTKTVIKYLENIYNPVKFDHKMHLGVADGCSSCHHKTDVKSNKKPKSCSTCHKIPFDKNNLSVPGLKGAFHSQCMGCHKKNDVSTSCDTCHKKK